MSHSYRVPISMKVNITDYLGVDTINKLGRFVAEFKLLEILPREEMIEMLKTELQAQGFGGTENELTMPTVKGKAVLDLDTLKMDFQVPLPEIILNDMQNKEYFDFKAFELSNIMPLAGHEKALLEKNKAFVLETIKKKSLPQLESLVKEANLTINKALKNIYKDAMLKKASKLGNVASIEETKIGTDFRIRIVVSE